MKLLKLVSNLVKNRSLVYRGTRRLATAFSPVFACEMTRQGFNWNPELLEHEFFIKQASTVNVNAASQLLVTIIAAIQDTSNRLRQALSQEIALIQQAVEWGEKNTPESHFDEIIAVRGTITDIKYNLQVLIGYVEFAEKTATAAAELSFLSGNTAASDMICERMTSFDRILKNEISLNEALQMESLVIQKAAIESSQQMKEILKSENE